MVRTNTTFKNTLYFATQQKLTFIPSYSPRTKRKQSRKRRLPISVQPTSVRPVRKHQTTSVLSTCLPPSTTLSSTWPIFLEEKPIAESPVVWKLRLIEKNHPHMLVRNLISMIQITYALRFSPSPHSLQTKPPGPTSIFTNGKMDSINLCIDACLANSFSKWLFSSIVVFPSLKKALLRCQSNREKLTIL